MRKFNIIKQHPDLIASIAQSEVRGACKYISGNSKVPGANPGVGLLF